MEGRLSAYDAAFDFPIEREAGADWSAPVAYLEDKRFDPANLIEKSDWEQQSIAQLQIALDTLDERSRSIINQRWLNENKSTLQELADHYGVSAERIRQLEANAMKKLKAVLDI